MTNRAEWTVCACTLKVRAMAAVNAVIALFKGPLLCENTMEWPFCDCSGLLTLNRRDQKRSLSFSDLSFEWLDTWIKAFEQRFYLNLHYFSRNSLVACGVSANATSVFESCFAGEHVPKPSAQILTIWLFADRVTVFDTVFELLICCGSTPVMKRVHRKCNFNRQLQYLPNEFVITCWRGKQKLFRL